MSCHGGCPYCASWLCRHVKSALQVLNESCRRVDCWNKILYRFLVLWHDTVRFMKSHGIMLSISKLVVLRRFAGLVSEHMISSWSSMSAMFCPRMVPPVSFLRRAVCISETCTGNSLDNHTYVLFLHLFHYRPQPYCLARLWTITFLNCNSFYGCFTAFIHVVVSLISRTVMVSTVVRERYRQPLSRHQGRRF